MTNEERNEILRHIEVEKAYLNGKAIEVKSVDGATWTLVEWEPSWDWLALDYRVKPEPPKPQYRPFENAEEVMEAIKEHGDWVRAKDGTYSAIVNVLKDKLFLGESISSCSYNYMLKGNYTFVDGTPFGKLIEK